MTTLHPQIISFFEARMSEHSCVERFTRMAVTGEYLYEVERTGGRKPVTVFLSDAYRFGEADYLGRPTQLRRGDFILVARPEAGFDKALIDRARLDGIGLGQIRKFMGALNHTPPCDYIPKEEKDDEHD
jgi:hypothetical protein